MTTPNQPPSGGGGGNVFTKKMGPLPLWGWMGVGLAIALAYTYYKQKNAKQPASAPTNTSAGTTNSNLIPQFVNQNFVSSPSQTRGGVGRGKEGGGPIGGGINNPPTGTVPPPAPGTTNNSPPVTIQVPNGWGGWMTVQFPSTQAMNSFYSSLGIGQGQPNGGYYPNNLSNAELLSYINGAGGSVTGGQTTQPPGYVQGAPYNTVYTGYGHG